MSKQPYREVTVSSILFGIVVGALMNASITYAGLKIGFTIGGSAFAAVLGFGVLRGILRRGTILETNIGQTVASAVNIPNSGIIFTVPVLYLMGFHLTPGGRDFWMITLACVVGAVLGSVLIIPLRKQMIDIDRLRFPTGTAVAIILKSPGAGIRKSLVLIAGCVIAMLIYLPVALPTIIVDGQPLWGYSNLDWRLSTPAQQPDPNDTAAVAGYERQMSRADRDGDGQADLVLTDDAVDVGRWLHLPDYLFFVFAIAPFALGAGYITGRPGLMVLAGGILAFFVLNPTMYLLGYMPDGIPMHEAPEYGYQAFNRPLGIGMLLGGAMMGVLFSLPAFKAAITSIASSTHSKGGSNELGIGVLLVATALCFVGLFIAADLTRQSHAGPPPSKSEASDSTDTRSEKPTLVDMEITQQDAGTAGWLSGLNPHVQSLIIALVGTIWIGFAGIIVAQCTGMTDWSPISGMALLTVVLIMLLGGTGDVLGAVLIGAALCVAVSCAADMMQDLKTGHLVGAVPKRQQLVELLCTGLGPVIAMGTILLIVTVNMKTKGVPIGEGTDTTAPQAQALQAVIQGVQGGRMPYTLYGCGAISGIALGLGAFSGLGVMIGLSMYLPIEYILTYGLGCLANMFVQRIKGRTWAEEWGVPLAAGLIVGEGILALVINFIVLIRG